MPLLRVEVEKLEAAKAAVVLATSMVRTMATVTVTDGAPAPSYGISLDHGGTHIFPAAAMGYETQTAETVAVTNTGNQATGALTIGLSGNSAAFELSKTDISDVAVSGTDSFTVEPATDLSAGTYTAIITVSGGSITSKAFDVSFTVTAAPVAYTIAASAGSGGSISPSGSISVEVGGSQTFTITSDTHYGISSVTVDGISQGALSSYTFANVTGNHSISAVFSYTGGGASSGSTAPATPTYNADITTGSGAGTALPVTVNKDRGSASIDIGTQGGGITNGKAVAVTIPSIPGVDSYALGIPVAYLSTPGGTGTLTFRTNTGSMTLPADMLDGVAGTAGKKAEIIIGLDDKSGLPDDVKADIGDRPLIQLTLTLDGAQTDWNNPGAPVTVSIPYTPTAEELENPEGIVIWYIDGSGNAVCIPNGHYDSATDMVTFTITHFSQYAVGYNAVSFSDVASEAWYAAAVGFIAAREITTGTGDGNFSPEAKLTRGQFVVMLMRAHGLSPDENPSDNFSDAGNTYYTGYLAAAKRLGISNGVGNNLFAPEKEITRQEMFTLLYNTLKLIGDLPQGDSGKTLADFTDTDQIGSWAKEAITLFVETGTVGGSDEKLTPTDTTTRAEMAQVLYNLLAE